jgi:predicted ATPase
LPAQIQRKRRVHFHEFMIEVHARLRIERQKEAGDPIIPVAEALVGEARLLAFDELVVNNSADAMIMSRLFTAMMARGLTVVATSNRAPKDLYKDGLNREHFLPFIGLIERDLDVLPLNGPVDYRLERLTGVETWHTPLGQPATDALREAFFRLTDYPPEDSARMCRPKNFADPRRPQHPCAEKPEGRRGLLVQAALRRSARCGRLSRDRAALSHDHHRRHSETRPGEPQRGRALRDADRRALRA